MRNGWTELMGALALASTLAVGACGDYDVNTGSASNGGSTGEPGASGGSAGNDPSNDSASGGASGSGGSSGGAPGSDGSGGSSAATPSASGCTMSEGGTAVTGLCGAAALNTLTPAEQLQLCSDTGAYVAASMDRAIACKYVAIVASASSSAPTEAEMQAVCAAREMSCNQDDTVMGAGALTQCSAIPATCAATLEQYSACVMDEAVVFEQGAGALPSCSTLTLANLSALYDVPTAAQGAQGCMALKAACPTFNLPYIN